MVAIVQDGVVDHAPLPDLDRPGELGGGIELPLDAAVLRHARHREILGELDLAVRARREHVRVLVDADEIVHAVAEHPLLAQLVGRTLGARLLGGPGRRRDEPAEGGADHKGATGTASRRGGAAGRGQRRHRFGGASAGAESAAPRRVRATAGSARRAGRREPFPFRAALGTILRISGELCQG